LAYHDLVQEILNELLLERPGSEKPVKISSEEFGDEVAAMMISPSPSERHVSRLDIHILER
jgi:hypothetical protein